MTTGTDDALRAALEIIKVRAAYGETAAPYGQLDGIRKIATDALSLPSSGDQRDAVIEEIAAERRRQVGQEGWTAEHDDAHKDRSMAKAAAAYCESAARPDIYNPRSPYALAVPLIWPSGWARKWWKPKDPRRDLIRAGALIVAEIERLDRALKSVPADKEKA